MMCLVTGGFGFIGSHLVDRLVKEGNYVVVVDNGSSISNVTDAMAKGAKILNMNVCSSLEDAFYNVYDAVFHLAAIPRVQFSIKEPVKSHDSNVNGALNVFEWCRKRGVKRVVFASSSSVYGDQDKLPLSEDMFPSPKSPYAAQKLMGEIYAGLYHKLYGLETVCLRYFNVFGPRQDPMGDYACVIPKFAALALNGKSPTINGNGNQTRDFTFVDDVVSATILAGQVKLSEFGVAFNVGAGRGRSVNEVAEQILARCNPELKLLHGPAVIEPRDTTADISKARCLLGWEPKVSFEEGLARTIDYLRTNYAGK
jgi:nucleoside-diphosphate-sugar epimerase